VSRLDRARRAVADASPAVFWWDDPAHPPPAPREALTGDTEADLVVVGGGYSGLWTALRALERDPGRSVVVLEAGRCGFEASGRNGGFASHSLTHGYGNGHDRWPEELSTLEAWGAENLRAMGEDLRRWGVDCGWEETGELTVATREHELAWLAEEVDARRGVGQDVQLLDAASTRARLDSPAFLGAAWSPDLTVMVEPARLAWGLVEVCTGAGVRVHEGTRATAVERLGDGVLVRTRTGRVRARRAVLATNAFPPLLRRLRRRVVPVYDHVLVTEPLSPEQRRAVGWAGREGVSDAGNLFHYFRLTHDDRVLWGGYDAVYHAGSRVDRSHEQHDRTHLRLAEHFLATFPQLEGIRFSHRWGGVIDTSTRFNAFYGTAVDGRVAYALGHTGLGVAATRFAADVVLDLLDGADTARTRSALVTEQPWAFPPEPLRWTGIGLTRWSLARSDRRGGRRNAWLRGLDHLGLGFDS
jgi:glycine/D-amino acid oxidase-like deaminating enzyme